MTKIVDNLTIDNVSYIIDDNGADIPLYWNYSANKFCCFALTKAKAKKTLNDMLWLLGYDDVLKAVILIEDVENVLWDILTESKIISEVNKREMYMVNVYDKILKNFEGDKITIHLYGKFQQHDDNSYFLEIYKFNKYYEMISAERRPIYKAQ